MNKCKFNLLVIAFLLLVPCLALALPGAHDPTSGGYSVTCQSCHEATKSYGNTEANYSSNVCLTCHLSGTNQTLKVFKPEDFADIAGTSTMVRGTPVQSSHKWFGSDVVPKAGALAPTDPAGSGLNKNTYFSGSLFCARCHNIHGTSGAQSNYAPYLRAANDSDQLCTNCHRTRDKSDHTFGTHPVNVSYSTAYKANPTSFRATPDSGSAISQLKLVKGKVVCSSCHKVHAADSRTATLDNYSTGHAFSNLSASKGFLLRVDARGKAANDVNICTNCHTNKFAHNRSSQNVQCNDCHSGHVEYDSAATGTDTSNVPNVYLVRRYLSYSAAGRISKRIIYNDVNNKKYYIEGGGGVCQSCHAVPVATHFSGGVLTRTNCSGCHNHNEVTGSFSPGAGACDTCHGYPVTSNANKEPGYTGNEDTSPHVTHVGGGSNYSFNCNQCHNGSVGAGATHNESPTKSYASVFIDKVAVGSGGVLAGSGATYSGGTCSAVYCHSDGTSTSATGSATWAGGLNTLNCGSCHAATPGTGSHTTHISTRGYGCKTCHAATLTTDATINVAGGKHVNTQKDIQFSQVAPATSTGTTCDTTYCHSDGAGTRVVAPVWGVSGGACGDCHKTAVNGALATGSHTTHFAKIPTGDSSCATCHDYTTTSGPNHVNGQISMLTPSDTVSCGICHADPYSASFNAPTWGDTATGCSACHTAGGAFTGTGTAPATGSHNKHMALASAACNQCHTGAVAGSDGGATHTNRTVEVSNSYTASPVTKHTAGLYSGTCSTTCHSTSTAAVSTPVWGNTATCASCHASSPTTGAHAKHTAITAILCADCHTGAVKDSNGGSAHGDGNIDISVANYPANIAKHAVGTYSGTCSTVCHSTSTTPVATPIWSATATCASCHASSPTTGAHTKHTAITAILCADCHTGAVKDSNGGSAHGDGNIDISVANYPANIAKHVVGTYSGTCSTVCHSTTATAVATPIWSATATCASCHASSPATGAHAKHTAITAILCADCHTGAVKDSNGGSAHGDGNIDISVANYPADIAKHVVGTYSGTCSTVCHSTSATPVATPIWSATATCASCHASSPTTGAHTKHTAITTILCADCHTGAVKDSNGGSAHGDGNIDVSVTNYPANIAKHVVGTYSGTCSTLCHSTSTTPVATPIWSATATCASCHASSPTTGTHSAHMALAGAACNQCHAGAVLNTNAGTAHGDGNIDVTNGYPTNVPKHVVGTYSGSCSTTACHGSGSPAWGAVVAGVTCTKCHGKPTLTNYSTATALQAAPGYAQVAGSGTYTNNVSDTAPYGAHDAHVRATNQYTTRKTLCSDCHGTLPTSGSHADGLTMSFSDLAKNIGTSGGNATTGPSTRGTLAPAYSAGSCSAVYCHGGVMAGTDTTPEWRFTGTSYLTPYAKDVTNCGKCHAALPVVAAKDHSAMTFATQNCNGCHGHEGNGSKHIDGILQASGACNSCHGYQAGSWAGAPSINAEGKGAHEAHITWLTTKRFPTITLNPLTDGYASAATTWTNVCGVCHGNTPGNHDTGTVNVELSSAFSFGGAPAYKGTPGTPSATPGSEKTCSNISCHYFTTPLWSTY